MNNTFQSYLMFAQLPDDLKKLNKLKLNPQKQRFDLLKCCGYFPKLESMKVKSKNIVYITLDNGDYTNGRNMAMGAPTRKPDYFLRCTNNNNSGKGENFTGMFFFGKVGANVNDLEEGTMVYYGNPKGSTDGYVILVSDNWQEIEVLFVPNGKPMLPRICSEVCMGILSHEIANLRWNARVFHDYSKV